MTDAIRPFTIEGRVYYGNAEYTPKHDDQALIDNIRYLLLETFRWDGIMGGFQQYDYDTVIEGVIAQTAWITTIYDDDKRLRQYIVTLMEMFSFHIRPWVLYRRNNPLQGDWINLIFKSQDEADRAYGEACEALMAACKVEVLKD